MGIYFGVCKLLHSWLVKLDEMGCLLGFDVPYIFPGVTSAYRGFTGPMAK